MINNVLSNLFSKPATRDFPAKMREIAENVRGSVEFNTENCVYCGACALKCPANAIEVDRPAKKVTFDLYKCVACACCAEACRKGCIQMAKQYAHPSYRKMDVVFQGEPLLTDANGDY